MTECSRARHPSFAEASDSDSARAIRPEKNEELEDMGGVDWRVEPARGYRTRLFANAPK